MRYLVGRSPTARKSTARASTLPGRSDHNGMRPRPWSAAYAAKTSAGVPPVFRPCGENAGQGWRRGLPARPRAGPRSGDVRPPGRSSAMSEVSGVADRGRQGRVVLAVMEVVGLGVLREVDPDTCHLCGQALQQRGPRCSRTAGRTGPRVGGAPVGSPGLSSESVPGGSPAPRRSMAGAQPVERWRHELRAVDAGGGAVRIAVPEHAPSSWTAAGAVTPEARACPLGWTGIAGVTSWCMAAMLLVPEARAGGTWGTARLFRGGRERQASPPAR